MLNPFRKPVLVGISETEACCIIGDPFASSPVFFRNAYPIFNNREPKQIATALEYLFDHIPKRSKVEIIFSDTFAKFFKTVPPTGSRSLVDLEAAVAIRFEKLYGQNISSHQLLSDWRPGKPFLTCAVPKTLISGIEAAIFKRSIRCARIAPHLISTMGSESNQKSTYVGLCTIEETGLTYAIFQGKNIVHIVQIKYMHRESMLLDEVAHYLKKEELLTGIKAPETVMLYSTIKLSGETGKNSPRLSESIANFTSAPMPCSSYFIAVNGLRR
jgi:hypothetical protein